MLDKLKAHLIEDWKAAGRFWSVRLGSIGLALGVTLQALPDIATGTWNALPADLKAALPVHFVNWISYGLIAASLIARVVKQKDRTDD